MDSTSEIKARLPIEELVGQYCQLKKKGRNFVSLCPFHNDTNPSFLISPDKGIAYCFACQNGGDIFSFYQAIEGVDFRQTLKDLGERTGVEIEGLGAAPKIQKDEKDRLRECLQAALSFYASKLQESASAKEYLQKRNVSEEQRAEFGMGVAPDSFSDTYQYLLKGGFSRKEIIDAGLGIQKELQEEKIYDRFRNRLMFPILDHQGKLVGFGGRTLGEDDAKYINSSEGPLYNKSTILYGLEKAKEAIRETKSVILVEGYFDVLACHRVGTKNVVAASGTALTQQHVKLLKRYAEKIILCLDQDRAGKDAADRAFYICSEEELPVHVITIPQKDPDEAAAADADHLKKLLLEGGVPYLDHIIELLRGGDVSSSEGKHNALQLLMPLLNALTSSVEKEHYLGKIAGLLSTTDTALKEDLRNFKAASTFKPLEKPKPNTESQKKDAFSSTEIALGLLLLFPTLRHHIKELIEPKEGCTAALYTAIKGSSEGKPLTLETLGLPEVYEERTSILILFCEHHGFLDWSESTAAREIKNNCINANRDLLRHKQQEIAQKLMQARKEGKSAEEAQLSMEYQQVLKLAKMAAY